MNNKIHIYIFLDNIPFASAGLIYGLEQLRDMCEVRSYYPTKYVSRRSNIDEDNFLKSCFSIDYDKDLEKFENSQKPYLKYAVFVSFGYTQKSFNFARLLSKKYSGKLIVISERPKIVSKNNLFKEFLLNLKHQFLIKKYSNDISGLFALGESGVNKFKALGFPSNKIFEFCYCPLIFEKNILIDKLPCDYNEYDYVYIYSGRLKYSTKSPNRLIDYFKKNINKALIVIGDYGEDKIDFFNKVKNITNIYLVGKKSIYDTVGLFKLCDCVLIPSTIDGWNVNVNLSLIAKTPVVITDSCGSDKIVECLNIGVVTKNTQYDFINGIEKCERNLNLYKSNFNKIGNVLSPEIISFYFFELIKFIINKEEGKNETRKPKTPWDI